MLYHDFFFYIIKLLREIYIFIYKTQKKLVDFLFYL